MSEDSKDHKIEAGVLRDLIKWFLGTFCISLLGVVTNYQIYKTQLELKRQEQDREYIGRFINQALDSDVKSRLRFSHYFSCLMADERWGKYYKDTLEEQVQKEQAILDLSNQVAALKDQLASVTLVAKASSTSSIERKEVASIAVQLIEKKAEIQQQIAQIKLDLNSSALESAKGKSLGWVYLGKIEEASGSGDIFKPATIIISSGSLPLENETYIISTNTNLREKPPTEDYDLAEKITTIPQGSGVKIISKLLHKAKSSLWAKVMVIY